MKVLGKIIGALVGFWLFRHLWDIGALRPLGMQRARGSFIAPLFALAGAIAKSDGRVSEQEIAATENLMTRMQMSPDQRASAIEHKRHRAARGARAASRRSGRCASARARKGASPSTA